MYETTNRAIAQGTDVDSRSKQPMDPLDLKPHPTRRGAGFWLRAITIVLIVPALVVIAWVAFGLQGYQNDPQSAVFQTWPAGVASLALAGSLTWIAIWSSPALMDT
jgi:hypothetical protein